MACTRLSLTIALGCLILMVLAVDGQSVSRNDTRPTAVYTVQLDEMVREQNGCHSPGDDAYFSCSNVKHGVDRQTGKETDYAAVYTWRRDSQSKKYTIRYAADDQLRQSSTFMSRLRRALRSIEAAVGCMQFTELSRPPSDRATAYLWFTSRDSNCFAQIGMSRRGRTVVNLGKSCHDMNTITHETLHALGMHHEHCRADRDRFISIDEGAVDPGKRHNFDKQRQYRIGSYDQHSVMHYEQYAFAKSRSRPSMRPRSSSNNPKNWGKGECTTDATVHGSSCSSYLSRGDKVKLRQLYKC